jgi:hypothetical protein
MRCGRPELAEHHAGARAAAILNDPLEARRSGSRSRPPRPSPPVQRPGEPVKQREAVGRPVAGSISAAVCGSAPTTSSRRVTHWTSEASPATKVVSTGHQPRPRRAAGTPRSRRRAAHPAAVERHHALAVLGVDQRLHGAPQESVARHAGPARRRAATRTGTTAGRVMDRDERAHAAREQPEALLPRVSRETAAVDKP